MMCKTTFTMLAVVALCASCGVQEHLQGATTTGGNGGGDPFGTTGTGGTVPTGSGGTTPTGSGGSGGALATDGGPTPTDAPPSGQIVMLGNMAVPKEKVIAFIHFGHSNMAGRGETPASLRAYNFSEVDPRAWMFKGSRNRFEPVKEPDSAGDSTSIQRTSGGPGTSIIKQAAAMAATGYHFVSVGFARNAAYCRQYLPGAPYYDGVVANIRPLKGKVTFGGIFVMLGITERHGTQADITDYPQCILKLVTAIRNEAGVPDLPLLLTDYEYATGSLARTAGGFPQQILPRIAAVATFSATGEAIATGAVPSSALVPTSGNLSLADDHHFELDAHKIWAQRALDIMVANKWFPWR